MNGENRTLKRIRREVLDARLNAKYHAYVQARHLRRARPMAVLLLALAALARLSWTSGWFVPHLTVWLVGGIGCAWEFRRAYLHRRLHGDWQRYRHRADALQQALANEQESDLDSGLQQLRDQRASIETREPQPPDRSLLEMCQREVQAELRPAPTRRTNEGATPGADGARKPGKPVFLVLMTCHESEQQLALTDEIGAIEDPFGRGDFRERYNVVVLWQVTASQLVELVAKYRPAILHIGGHGDRIGVKTEYQLETVHLRYDELVRCFAALEQKLRLVVLNVCFSGRATTELAAHVDAAIGMRDAVEDEEAIVFAGSLYRALGEKQSLQQAFDQARNDPRGPPSSNPQLTPGPGVDPNAMIF